MARSPDQYVNGLQPRLERLVRTLEGGGYVFANPTEVLPGPPSDVDAAIARVERLVGALPVALALFYRRVGSVDLRGNHPAWCGCDYPDPLVVDPITAVLEEAEEYSELEGRPTMSSGRRPARTELVALGTARGIDAEDAEAGGGSGFLLGAGGASGAEEVSALLEQGCRTRWLRMP